jgi:NarL family two-component system response regulator LiaR
MIHPDPIRVLLVDDHEMVRQGLAVFLSAFDDFELVGEASNGLEALQMCGELNPEVVLMDLLMPEMGGIEATRQILEQHPQTQILIITSFEEEHLVQEALQSGAIGFLLKNTSIDNLAAAIRNAHAGKPSLSPEATQALITAATRPPEPSFDLTRRELDVLAQLVEGRKNPEIAEVLSISRSTVKTHVSNILGKLGVTSRVEAVRLALEKDLLKHPPSDG